MAAGKYDFTIEQGATFSRHMVWNDANGNPISLVGKAARMQIRPSFSDPTVWLQLHTDDGTIVLTNPGVIDWLVGADVTTTLTFKHAVYDFEVYDPGDPTEVERVLQGKVTLSPEVTR